jgi:hypothetical protein
MILDPFEAAGEGVAFGDKISHFTTQIVPQMLRPYTYLTRRDFILERSNPDACMDTA